MVTTKERVFFVSGSDFAGRRLIIESIKKRTLKGGSDQLNILNFYPKEINIKDLQEKVFLSSFSGERILIFKDAYNLPKEVREFLHDNLNKIISGNYLVFEAESDNPSTGKKVSTDKLFNLLLSKASCYKTPKISPKVNFDDFKKSIRQNDIALAIYVLDRLFEDKSSDSEKKALGLQIFGVLVSEISYLKNGVLRKKYFNYLLEADRAMKERGFDPRFAIELFLSRTLEA